jgi:hypothetical protein
MKGRGRLTPAVPVVDQDLVGRYPDDFAVLPAGDGIAEPFVHEQGFLNRSGYRGFDSGRFGDQLGKRIGVRSASLLSSIGGRLLGKGGLPILGRVKYPQNGDHIPPGRKHGDVAVSTGPTAD